MEIHYNVFLRGLCEKIQDSLLHLHKSVLWVHYVLDNYIYY